jgi:hypothetical protein
MHGGRRWIWLSLMSSHCSALRRPSLQRRRSGSACDTLHNCTHSGHA